MLCDCSELDFKRWEGIIVYGTGDDAIIAKKRILKDFQGLVIYCDSYKIGEFMGEKIISPKEILSYPKYPVLIASRKYEYEIYSNLLENKVSSESIFSLKKMLDKADHPGKMCINGFEIEMDSKSFCWADKLPMYDKFLSIMAGVIKGGYIVDVGANVGDSALLMLPFTDSNILCIEPQENYYSLLKKNLEQLPCELKKRITTKQCLISDDTCSAYALASQDGTAHMYRSNELNYINGKKLGDVVKEEHISLSDVRLIKSDTDGNDFRCLMSLGKELKDISPLLYFENELHDEITYDGFNELGKYLKENNYEDFWFFDNYGNYLGHGSINMYNSLNLYLKRMLTYDTPRTFWYLDILAAKADKVEICSRAIRQYEKKFFPL